MSARKTILLAAIASLSVIFVIQSLLGGKDSVKTVKLADGIAIDSISIARADGTTVNLSKEGDAWFVGDRKYPVDKNAVDGMVAALGEIRVIDTVSRSGDLERYGLDGAAAVTVTASKAGKAVRAIVAGKNASAAGQSYALVDGSKAVSLVSGSLKDTFDKDAESLRDKTVWSTAREGITRIEAEGTAKDCAFVLAKAGDPASWQIAAPESAKQIAIDGAKADSFALSFSSIVADSYAPEGTALPDKPVARFVVQGTGKQYTLTVGAKNAADAKYLCSSSETPYAFYMTASITERLLAPYTSLKK
jgi:hypothetical protein